MDGSKARIIDYTAKSRSYNDKNNTPFIEIASTEKGETSGDN